VLLIVITAATLTLHYYGLLFEGVLGHSHLIHVIHARLCYIPIVLGAVWFGLRGGITTAVVISIFAVLYIQLKPVIIAEDLINEYTEIAFYLAIGGMAGILVDRDRSFVRKKEEAERKLQQAQRLSMMGQMTASIAHEIKNPLGSIKGASQILKDDSLSDEEKHEFAEMIEKEADRLDFVVKDFLSYARPSPSRFSEIDLREILNSAYKQLKYQARDSNIEINMDFDEVPSIKADPDKLRQVFLNILLNSFQAMPDGGKIEIKCLHDNGDAVIIIRDNGIGIPVQDLDKIYDPFYTTKSRGSGLGLATTKAIIEEHNGAIKADSARGEGTTFKISLPIEGAEH
ncbi:MAG TPA: PAS domain-containing sensor histidine kinase, partial [candidate division Zixibacteria bacterium]|nr:PAS domain-containing sensor histidine kinase [candidate division Zixibacteria bacterium]